MKMKKVLAGMLTATTLIASMSITAGASVEEVTTTALPNLTAYYTDYTTVSVPSELTDNQQILLMVQGAAADWSSVGGMTAAEAADVDWNIITSAGNVSVISEWTDEIETDKYVASAIVEVSTTAQPGLTVVEASNSQGGYSDFSVLVNAGSSTVITASNIENRFYDASGTSEQSLGSAVCGSVASNNYMGNSNYASVLDAPLALLTAANTPVMNYSIVPNYGTYTLKAVTFFNDTEEGYTLDTDFSDYTSPGWQYRVYDSTGAIKGISAQVGADDFSLEDNDIIVWKYGTYGINFANNISVN